jgi:hypothetical protein
MKNGWKFGAGPGLKLVNSVGTWKQEKLTMVLILIILTSLNLLSMQGESKNALLLQILAVEITTS